MSVLNFRTLLNTINVLSDFIWPRPFEMTFFFFLIGMDKREHYALFGEHFGLCPP